MWPWASQSSVAVRAPATAFPFQASRQGWHREAKAKGSCHRALGEVFGKTAHSFVSVSLAGSLPCDPALAIENLKSGHRPSKNQGFCCYRKRKEGRQPGVSSRVHRSRCFIVTVSEKELSPSKGPCLWGEFTGTRESACSPHLRGFSPGALVSSRTPKMCT